MSAEDDATEAAMADEFARFLATFGDDFEAPFDRVVRRTAEYLPPRPRRETQAINAGGGPGPADRGALVAALVEDRVACGRPASFTRLGDGEGSLLAIALGRWPRLTASGRARVLHHQFGGGGLPAEASAALLAHFHDALRSADLLGIPNRGTLRWVTGLDPPNMYSAFGFASVFEYLDRHAADLGLPGKIVASASFHTDLLPYYGALVEGRDVGLVSCRSVLAGALQGRWGATSVTLVEIPDSARTGSAPSTRHFPDRFTEVVEELKVAVRPGMLFLIAAGALAKIYCAVVKEHGGVALDIGSVADTWAGVRSRPWTDDAYLRAWGIVEAPG
jgi:hypothetical protein